MAKDNNNKFAHEGNHKQKHGQAGQEQKHGQFGQQGKQAGQAGQSQKEQYQGKFGGNKQHDSKKHAGNHREEEE